MREAGYLIPTAWFDSELLPPPLSLPCPAHAHFVANCQLNGRLGRPKVEREEKSRESAILHEREKSDLHILVAPVSMTIVFHTMRTADKCDQEG